MKKEERALQVLPTWAHSSLNNLVCCIALSTTPSSVFVLMAETIRGNDINNTGPTPLDALRQMANIGSQWSPVGTSPGGVRQGGITVINPNLGPLAPTIASWTGTRGNNWIRGLETSSTLTGYLTPNSDIPDFTAHGRTWSTARSFHPGGVQIGLADGSVRFVRESVSISIWRALWTRAGGESAKEF